MNKYILTILLLLFPIIVTAATFNSNPTLLLDREFSNGEFAGMAEEVVSILNYDLKDIQINTKKSDKDYGIHAFFYSYSGNGTTQDIIAEYTKSEQHYVSNARNEIRLMIDSGQSGFSGGSHIYCKGTDRLFDETCTNGQNLVGKVSLSKNSFKKLAADPFNWEKDLYGEDYLQKDILLHEIGHSIDLKHQMGPYMSEDKIFKHTGTPNHFAELTEPNMDPSRSSWTSGLTYTDKAFMYDIYGVPDHMTKVQTVNVELVTNGSFARGLNIGFIPVNKSTKKQLKTNFKKYKHKDIKLAKNKAVARSFYDNKTKVLVQKGNYFLKVRNIARIVSLTSRVHGENVPNPYFEGIKWVCKKKKKVLYLCDSAKKAKKVKIKKDEYFYINLEN